jgi:hypothetical protein
VDKNSFYRLVSEKKMCGEKENIIKKAKSRGGNEIMR